MDHVLGRIYLFLTCQGTQVEVFVPKYQLRGRVHMVDRRGLVIPPLLEGQQSAGTEQPESGGLSDAFADAERRELRCRQLQFI